MPGSRDMMEKNQPCLECTQFINGDMLCRVRQREEPTWEGQRRDLGRGDLTGQEGPKKRRWGRELEHRG